MIYVASKVRWWPLWVGFKTKFPIISTWIHEPEAGQSDMEELWFRIGKEIQKSRGLVLWVTADDFPLKGALIETGMALALNLPVYVVFGTEVSVTQRTQYLGSWICHPNVRVYTGFGQLESVLTEACKGR